MGAASLTGIAITGKPHKAAESVLTPDALTFVAKLARSVQDVAATIALSS